MVSTEDPGRMIKAPQLEPVIARCLAKPLDQRYQDVGELAADLEPFASVVNDATVVALGESTHTSGGYYAAKYTALAAAFALVFVWPLLLVPALLVWSRRPQKLKWSIRELLFGTPEAPSRLAFRPPAP